MRLRIVGCSGSVPGTKSATSCYLLSVVDSYQKTWNIVIDLGSGSLGKLQSYISLEKIDAILISHLHPDHYLDLCGLYVSLKYGSNSDSKSRVPIWSPKECATHVSYAYSGSKLEELDTEFIFHNINQVSQFKIGPLSIFPFPVYHLEKEAYAFRIEKPAADGSKKIFTYSGDTDLCANIIAAAQKSDLFLCEASYESYQKNTRGIHLTGESCGKLASIVEAKKLLITHIPPWKNQEKILQEARNSYRGSAELAIPGNMHTI